MNTTILQLVAIYNIQCSYISYIVCSCILYIATNCMVVCHDCMYVYIDIYTLQLCIIDLTQRG